MSLVSKVVLSPDLIVETLSIVWTRNDFLPDVEAPSPCISNASVFSKLQPPCDIKSEKLILNC